MPQKSKQPDIDAKMATQALEYLLTSHYISKKRLYFENFMRGIFFSLGSVLGAAVLIAFLIWFLSLFSHLPFIGHFVQLMRDSVNSVKSAH
jgi:hypothetical protein